MVQKMSSYERKAGNVEAVQVTAYNAEEIAETYGLIFNNGQLYSNSGTLISAGTWVCRLTDGAVRIFSDDVFKRLFDKVEPPTYKLSDVPSFDKGIRRKCWNGLYIKDMGFCFATFDEDGVVAPYIMTLEDLSATDWMICEE